MSINGKEIRVPRLKKDIKDPLWPLLLLRENFYHLVQKIVLSRSVKMVKSSKRLAYKDLPNLWISLMEEYWQPLNTDKSFQLIKTQGQAIEF